MIYMQIPSFLLNKRHGLDIEIKRQGRVFNQKFERWIHWQQILGIRYIPK